MTNHISRRDWERLSTYLDGQLSPREQTQLLARLETEPDLHAALENLRATRDALRSLPPVKAPRNFTLSSEMVSRPRRKPTPLVPVFRLASVLASLLFVIVVVGDVLGLGRGVGMIQPAMEAPVAEMAVEEEQMQEQEEDVTGVAVPTVTIVAEDVMDEAREGEAEKAAEPEAYAAEEEAEEQPAALEAEATSPQGTPTPLDTVGNQVAATPTESPTSPPPTETSTLTLTPTSEPTSTPDVITPPEQDLGAPAFSFIRVLEILLAATAIMSAGVAFLLRKRK